MNFRDKLKNSRIVLDGGMGTLLQEMGLKPGEAPEIWNITNPDKKNTGTMVSKSITPSNEIKKRSFACLLPILGYKYSAVQIRRTYSTQKMPSVTYSIAFNPIVIRDNSSNVCANVTRIFKTIVIVINISNALLMRLLLSPI